MMYDLRFREPAPYLFPKTQKYFEQNKRLK